MIARNTFDRQKYFCPENVFNLSTSHRWDHFPGPKGWQSLPFIGHAYLLGNDPIKGLMELKKKYGNVFRLDLGETPNVVIAGLKEANESYKSEVGKKLAQM